MPGARVAVAQRDAAPSPPESVILAADEAEPAESKVEKRLNVTTDVLFLDVPVQDALLFLKQQYSINVNWDKEAIEQAGIKLDTQVNVGVSGVRLRSVLNIVLKPLKLAYIVEKDGLKITSRAAAGPEKKREEPISRMESKIRKALDYETEVDFVERPLRDALKLLQDQYRFNIWIDEAAFREAKVKGKLPVNLQINAKMSVMLKLLLEPLGMTHVVEDEVLKITAQPAVKREATK